MNATMRPMSLALLPERLAEEASQGETSPEPSRVVRQKRRCPLRSVPSLWGQ
jgi:hypothetical protein